MESIDNLKVWIFAHEWEEAETGSDLAQADMALIMSSS